MVQDTREKLLVEAEILFADKGFYGASINAIATQLGMTKQGLLHHFPSKKKLYGAVLERAANVLISDVDDAIASSPIPEQQLDLVILKFTSRDQAHFRISRLLMREILDNVDRAAVSANWYLAPLLEKVEGIIEEGKKQGHFVDVSAMAFIFNLLGALQYFTVSLPTMKQMLSANAYKLLMDNQLSEIQRAIRNSLLVRQ